MGRRDRRGRAGSPVYAPCRDERGEDLSGTGRFCEFSLSGGGLLPARVHHLLCSPGGDVRIESDRAKAISLALSGAKKGDVVLICGKGHETTQEINGVKYPFDDREVVKECEVKK